MDRETRVIRKICSTSSILSFDASFRNLPPLRPKFTLDMKLSCHGKISVFPEVFFEAHKPTLFVLV